VSRLGRLFLVAALAACSGIPILSLPKLIALQGKLLDANPEEFMIAIQADARLAPQAGSSPVLDIDIKPKDEGDYPRVQRILGMQATDWSPRHKGLAPAPSGRKWLVYSFTPESAAECRLEGGWLLRALVGDARRVARTG